MRGSLRSARSIETEDNCPGSDAVFCSTDLLPRLDTKPAISSSVDRPGVKPFQQGGMQPPSNEVMSWRAIRSCREIGVAEGGNFVGSMDSVALGSGGEERGEADGVAKKEPVEFAPGMDDGLVTFPMPHADTKKASEAARTGRMGQISRQLGVGLILWVGIEVGPILY